MKRFILLLIITLVSLTACKEHKANIEALRLNNGEKWEANPETTEGFKNIQKELNAFEGSEISDFKALGKNLGKQTSYIIEHCSMKGEAHEQLHHVLLPVLDNISILRESKNKPESKQAVKNLNGILSTYPDYFNF